MGDFVVSDKYMLVVVWLIISVISQYHFIFEASIQRKKSINHHAFTIS